MIISYRLLNSQDIFEKDSSLSLGYFIINGHDILKDTYCIITIALTELFEGIQSLSYKSEGRFLWIPADSGETILFVYRNNALHFQYNGYNEVLPLKAFLTELKTRPIN